jgi:hypothetical protein
VKKYPKTYKSKESSRNIRNTRINTRENCTEKIHENGGKKSAKSLAQTGNCYIRRALPTVRPHTFGGLRKVIISNRFVWVHNGFPSCVDCPYYRRVRDGDAAHPAFGEDPRQLPGSPRGFQDPGVRGGPGAAHSHPVFQGLAREGPVLGPRDLAIRANIFSTGWIDLAATVGMREMALASSTSPTPPATGSQWLSERTTNQGFRCRGFGFHELELWKVILIFV